MKTIAVLKFCHFTQCYKLPTRTCVETMQPMQHIVATSTELPTMDYEATNTCKCLHFRISELKLSSTIHRILKLWEFVQVQTLTRIDKMIHNNSESMKYGIHIV
jgi:hypothetical protein